jgi:hypothetical protein
MRKKFKDTKGVIRIRKSKNDRQHNDQKKKYKRTNNDVHTNKTKDQSVELFNIYSAVFL